MNRGEFEEALTCLEKTRRLRPADLELNQNLGYVLLRLNRLDEAETLFLEAGDSATTLSNLGSIAMRDGRLVGAEL